MSKKEMMNWLISKYQGCINMKLLDFLNIKNSDRKSIFSDDQMIEVSVRKHSYSKTESSESSSSENALLYYSVSELLSSHGDYIKSLNVEHVKIMSESARDNGPCAISVSCSTDKETSDIVTESRLPSDKSVDPEFGLPDKKKYPLFDKAHVLSAIKFFNYTSGEDSERLASAIKSKMKQYGISSESVGEDNRLKNYL